MFLATLDARLIALDAATGQYCPGFGHDGSVDLFDGLTGIADRWEYNVTSPVTVVGDVVVVGSSIADTIRRAAPPGDVRAYDARSGALRWTLMSARAKSPGVFRPANRMTAWSKG